MAISKTINLPAWGTECNNDDTIKWFGDMLLANCMDIRGITCYPDGGRGGQPLTEVSYEEAKHHKGVVYEENENVCVGGICGL